MRRKTEKVQARVQSDVKEWVQKRARQAGRTESDWLDMYLRLRMEEEGMEPKVALCKV